MVCRWTGCAFSWSYVQAEFDAALGGLGIQPSVRLRCCSFPASMAALKTGEYATLMICFPGADPLPEDVEIVPLPCLEHTHRDIHLAWNPRLLQIRPEAERIRTALHKHLAWSDD
jgi:DNA-binding transcriptional LysR family regulator